MARRYFYLGKGSYSLKSENHSPSLFLLLQNPSPSKQRHLRDRGTFVNIHLHLPTHLREGALTGQS